MNELIPLTDPFKIAGYRVLVTGASSGIGRQVAIWLSKQGAKIVLAARNTKRLEETLLRLDGDGHVIKEINFLDGQDISAWMKELASEFGLLDSMVHAAGVQDPKPIRASSLAHWEKLMQTNVTSAFSLIKAFRQRGVHQDRASIVLISSVMAKVGQPALLAYCASKGAIESMVRSAALELAPQSIRVNAVSPGMVKTEMVDSLAAIIGTSSMQSIEDKHPLGLGEAIDVAYAVNYLLSPAARWVTGTSLVVDGGYLAD